MSRPPDSHKGENGKVAIIGGSRFIHGAPILSALAAEASGADLLYLFVPPCHEEVAKQASLNFQVRTFGDDALATRDVGPILELLASMDGAVIGPGLDRTPETLAAIRQLIEGAACPLVLDASALQPFTPQAAAGKTAVLTPHRGELERMHLYPDILGGTAREHRCTIVLKGQTDAVAGPDGVLTEVAGGTAGLTVGGTGDALAGLIAGLIAQGEDPTRAAIRGSSIIKRAAELLTRQKRPTFRARDVIWRIPMLLHEEKNGK